MNIIKSFLIIIFIFLQFGCISINSAAIEKFYVPSIYKAFIYKTGGNYILKIVMGNYSKDINPIKNARIKINKKTLQYSINKDGLNTEPFKLKSESNILSSIEIETLIGTNNPVFSNRKLVIAPSINADISQSLIPPSDYKYRKALVIGNAQYNSPNSPLKNPENDAEDVARVLKDLGFKVTKRTNLSLLEMKETIEEFSSELKKGNEVRVFFYAGHGLEVDRENYLVPIDAKDAIALGDILNSFGSYNNVLNITILDTCRENPFSEKVRSNTKIKSYFANRSAVIKNTSLVSDRLKLNMMSSGTIKAFATSSSKSAYDGKDGSNGVYTRYLLEHIKEPNISVETLLKLVSQQVQDKTINYKEVQVPWVESSYIGTFSFSTSK